MWFYHGEVAPLLRIIDMSETACITSQALLEHRQLQGRINLIFAISPNKLCPTEMVVRVDLWGLPWQLLPSSAILQRDCESTSVVMLSILYSKGKSLWVSPCHDRRCCSWPRHTGGPPGNSISYVPLKVPFCSPLQ